MPFVVSCVMFKNLERENFGQTVLSTTPVQHPLYFPGVVQACIEALLSNANQCAKPDVACRGKSATPPQFTCNNNM